VHIPQVLYHWRMIPGSAAMVIDAKPTALINGRRALEDAVKDENGVVVEGAAPGTFRVKWPVSPMEPVTLVILTGCRRREVEGRGDILLVEHFVKSIRKNSSHRGIRILVVDDGDMPAQTKETLKALDVRIEKYKKESTFNYARKLNFSVNLADTEYVIMLNDDLEVIASDWIEALLEMLVNPEVGLVGGKLLYPNDCIQHAGMALGVIGGATHVFIHWPDKQVGYNAFTDVIRNYSAVTGAVMATRLSLFKKLGGFDERYETDYNDVDFCLRVIKEGYRVVYTPFAKLYHFEGSSIQREKITASNEARFKKQWADMVNADPYYNINLPHDRNDFAIFKW
jgi:GT2 family glycosyltransferase